MPSEIMTHSVTPPLCGKEKFVADHYNSKGTLDYELHRLEVHSPVEYHLTLKKLKLYLKSELVVCEVGLGFGHYSSFLVNELGCHWYGCDITEVFLNESKKRIQSDAKHQENKGSIKGTFLVSGTQISSVVPSKSCDAVLLLGPLYHLTEEEQRKSCINEALKILKPGGILFAAGINQLAHLRDILMGVATKPGNIIQEFVTRHDFHMNGFLKDGVLTEDIGSPIGLAHLTTIPEFEKLCTADGSVEKLELLGVEGFTQCLQNEYKKVCEESEEARECILKLLEQTASTIEGMGRSDHFLFIGRKK